MELARMTQRIQTSSPAGDDIPAAGRSTNYRWMICGLLFFATTVNYVDRSVLAVLSPMLQDKIGWTNTEYGFINAAFSAAYAIGLLFAGGLLDKFGTRLGYPLAMALWGIASVSHILVTTSFGLGIARVFRNGLAPWFAVGTVPLAVIGFGIVRVFLGLFEAGNFPAAMKTVAEWFPRKERSLCVGLFNSGSNIGAILAPLVVPVIAYKFGWQYAFCLTGVLELIWIICWLGIYREPARHPRVNAAELNHIMSDPADPPSKIAWARLLPFPQTWAFGIAKALTDPIWWFWLFWAAPYLKHEFQVDLKHIGLPLIVLYNLASIGSIGGGWIPVVFLRMGFTHGGARKMSLLFCGLCVVPVMVVSRVHNLWGVVFLLGLAAAAHQGFSANLFALTGDLFPRRVVGSITGIGGMMGGVASIVLQISAGIIVDHTGYFPLFIVFGLSYLVAVLVIQLLAPGMERANFDVPPNRSGALPA
jgi:ACS family hexuronate transporter-like MFS transporter